MNDTVPADTTNSNGSDTVFGFLQGALQTAASVYEQQNPPAGYMYNPTTGAYSPSTVTTAVAGSQLLQIVIAVGVIGIVVVLVAKA